MSETIQIAARFHGPPSSGNGGYVCGCAARFIGGPAEVTLRAPPPLDTPLDVVREGDEIVLREGVRDIARARRAELTIAPPPSPGADVAAQAAARYRGHHSHAFPSCFTCGPQRAEGDGLRIFAGPTGEGGGVAAPWSPSTDLAADDGLVAPEFLWAALDCPSYWALPQAGALTAVLGRLSAAIARRPATGEPLVVAAWPLGAEGRKHRAASALYDAHGAIIARADALWIEVKPEQFA